MATSFIYDMADTWNNALTAFRAIKMDVTNTASGSGSLLMELLIGGDARFTVDTDGNLTVGRATGNFIQYKTDSIQFAISGSIQSGLHYSSGGTHEIRGGATAQDLYIYEEYTSGSDYIRYGFETLSTGLQIVAQGQGAHVFDNLDITFVPQGTGAVKMNRIGATADLTLSPEGKVVVESDLDAGSGSEDAFRVLYDVSKAGGDDYGIRTSKTDNVSGGTSYLLSLTIGFTPHFEVTQDGTISVIESSDHVLTPSAGYSQLWVKDDTPNRWMVTDDAGTDRRFCISKEVALSVVAYSTALTTGDGKLYFRIPSELNGLDLIEAGARVGAAMSTSGQVIVQIARGRAATAGGTVTFTDMLTTDLLDIDANEWDSKDAASQPNITTSGVQTGDLIRIDVDGVGTGSQGLFVTLSFG